MGAHRKQMSSPRSQLRSRSPCISPRTTSPRTSPRSFLRVGRCHLESQAALLLRQTAHPALIELSGSDLDFVLSCDKEDKIHWDSKSIQEWKSKLAGSKGRADPAALLHCLVASLADTYRLQVLRSHADAKPRFTVPSATLAPSHVLADIVFASLSAMLHSQEGLQLKRIVFCVEEMSMQKPLLKALERLRCSETTWSCTCTRCGGVHDTMECPHFVQSSYCDPDAQLRAEAMCRGCTPNAALYTPREDVEWECEERSAPSGSERVGQQSTTTSVTRPVYIGYQQLPHGDSGALSPRDCDFHIRSPPEKVKCCQSEPKKSCQSHSNMGGGARFMCRPKPCSANATPLEVLNLQKNFTDQDLRSAYKKAVLVWHPDRPVWQNASQEELQAATDMFRRVKEAYDMICAKR